MANNRLQIYCNRCLEMKVLAKYYPVDWSVPESIGKEMNEFIAAHQKCSEAAADGMWGTKMFTFRTEMDDDGLLSDYNERPFKVRPINPITPSEQLA